ncbi:CST complex subunit CTC1 [Chanos chanos]|uniref:CST complex subunit CTC1 n=1 Tax=Chanos chanos TaxID=29144 RepID=A0A6J2VG52_CHACN|nr:CST complex subunit CTC1 [Chanos chanos]
MAVELEMMQLCHLIAEMDAFLEHFKKHSRVERSWLREVYSSVRGTLYPVVGASLGLSAEQLALAVVRTIQRTCSLTNPSLPVSYRMVSISELVSRQRTPCCSSLTWSTRQYRDWASEAEQVLPSHKALPRTNLLLIGCLCAGGESSPAQEASQCDGLWRVKDESGTVHCEIINPSPDWVGELFLFPTWNFIPQNAPERGVGVGGNLELVGSPVCIFPDQTTFDPGGPLNEFSGVRETARLLQLKSNGARLCVSGKVCVLCPLLDIGGKRFFCFRLQEGNHTVAILVMEPECLLWRQCLYVGHRVCVSGLRVCSLKGWTGHRMLCVTAQSRLHLTSGSQGTLSADPVDTQTETDSHVAEALSDSHTTITPSQSPTHSHTQSDLEAEEPMIQAEAGPSNAVSTVRAKQSKIISYKGVVTSVLNAEAGLYEIDGRVGLCLAFQPVQKWGGGLRPGVEIELHNVHFLYRPSPFTLPTMLCACLRSSVSVTAFSRLETKVMTPPQSNAPLLHCLLRKNLGVSEYLWLCYCQTRLKERLCPRWVSEERVCVVAERLLDYVLEGREQKREERRDIYREMLEEPHYCPVTEYYLGWPDCELMSVRELCEDMEKECWSSLSLSALLPPSAAHMTGAELNPALAWSVQSVSLLERAKPVMLVGVLQLSPTRATVQLHDHTARVDCVITQTGQSGSQCAMDNTAWLGCLVCVRHCTLVMERFLRTEFPSWKHLNQEEYITHKYCRLYIQFCVEDLHILSPSAAMINFSRERKSTGDNPAENDRCTEAEGDRRSEHGYKEHEEHERAVRERRNVEKETTRKRTAGKEGGEGTEEPSQTALTKRLRQEEEKTGMEESDKEGAFQPDDTTGRSDRRQSKRPLGNKATTLPQSSCVSRLFRLEVKQGVAFRNTQASKAASGLTLSFVAKVTCLGEVQRWERDPKNSKMEERERGVANTVEFQFVGSSVRWFPLLQPGSVYRLVALHTDDVGVLNWSQLPERGGVTVLCNPSLLVQPQWRIHTLTGPLLAEAPSQAEPLRLMSVSEVLHCSSLPDIVSFRGVISQRITLHEERGQTTSVQSLNMDTGMSAEQGLRVRLTIQDSETPGQTVQVYVDLSHCPYTPGLVAGATVFLHDVERKVSQVNNVYCRTLPISCLTVTGLGLCRPCPPPPMVLLGQWISAKAQHCVVGQVKGHIVCVLHLRLQWACSLCGSVFKQTGCTRTCPPCDSTSSVFQAEAKAAVEDGSGEAQVWFSSQMVAKLLLLEKSEWEGLQRHVRGKGHIRVFARGRSMVCETNSDEPLVQYLCSLCASNFVCRQIMLTCQLRSHKQEKAQLRKMSRGEREFLTKFPHPLQLNCIDITEETHTHYERQ